MPNLISADGLHLDYPTTTVFDSVSLGVNEGDRIGIVGRNGDGKSSLLELLTQRREPDAGQVTVRRGTRLGVLDQRDDLHDEDTVIQAVVGDVPDHVWAADAKVRDVVNGLLGDFDRQALVGALSGGQRRRVALAKVLAQQADVIALDEPTNHLDLEAITWLAGHLKQRWTPGSGALLVVTHDRWFLDEVSETTWEVHDQIVEPFDGGYAAYIMQRVERDRQAAAHEERRQNLARKELAWLGRGAPARSSKPKFHVEAAKALIADEPPVRDSVSLQSLAISRLGKQVVDLLGVSVSYGDHEVLHDVQWLIAPGERTGILGVNGAGKSTLLSLINGTLKPTSGRVRRGATVKVATLTQQMTELTEFQDEPVQEMLAGLHASYTVGTGSKAQELTPAQFLEQMGFASGQLDIPVKDLSGGQQRRLQLLLVLLGQPNVLILDEPTNDLDTDMLTALEDLLDSWAGTLIVVSHDRYFLERVTDQQYSILDGRLRHLPNGVDEYLALRHQQQENAQVSRPAGLPKTESTSANDRAARKELAAIERKLKKLATKIDAQQVAMAEHDQSDYQGIAEQAATLKALQTENEQLEDQWLVLSENL